MRADHVLLATGGAGQMFAVTTNPVEATGDGIAMALRAGVAVADVEFVQFHPTALHHPRMPRPLLSEALRGHGALLRDTNGERFVDELPAARRGVAGDDPAHARPRRRPLPGSTPPASSTSTRGSRPSPWPSHDAGLDPATDWLPIAPAAHYLCGGVVADLDGATSLPHLWAAGEVACSGVHGANRLASNSLLEGMVFGFRVIEAIDGGKVAPEPTGAMRSVSADAGVATGSAATTGSPIGGRAPSSWEVPTWGPPSGVTAAPAEGTDSIRTELQRSMTVGAGVLRSATSLADTAALVEGLAKQLDDGDDGRARWEARNLVDVSRGVLAAATERHESRGAHTRVDFAEPDAAYRLRLVLAAPD